MSRCFGLMILIVLTLSFMGCEQTTPQTSQLSSSPAGEVNQVSNDPLVDANEKINKPRFFYQKSADKKNEIVEGYIRKAVNNQFSQLFYYYNYSDLNDDGKHEVLVLIQMNHHPNQSQAVLIFNDAGKKIGHIENCPTPIVVSSIKENEYRILYKPMGRGRYEPYALNDSLYGLKTSSILEFDQLDGIGYLSDVGDKRGFQLK